MLRIHNNNNDLLTQNLDELDQMTKLEDDKIEKIDKTLDLNDISHNFKSLTKPLCQ